MIPFRDSAVTHVLKDILNNPTNSFMILAVSPDKHKIDETINVFRFGSRAMLVKALNKPKSKENGTTKPKPAVDDSTATNEEEKFDNDVITTVSSLYSNDDGYAGSPTNVASTLDTKLAEDEKEVDASTHQYNVANLTRSLQEYIGAAVEYFVLNLCGF